MKRFLTFAVMLILALCLFGCGTLVTPPGAPTTEIPGKDNPTTPDDPDTPIDDSPFTVDLVCEGFVYIPDEPMSVLWTAVDGSSLHEAEFDDDGVAAAELDGDYNVTLKTLPRGYTYNPNVYTADNENKHVTVELYKLLHTFGKGTDFYSNVIEISQLGAYRMEFTKPGQQIYCQYRPIKAGMYSIESINDITANEVNPRIDIYIGNNSWKPNKPNVQMDGGGVSSIYTKNFKYDVNVSDDGLGSVYAFALKFDSRVGTPVYVDFIITRNGEFDGVNYWLDPAVPRETLALPEHDGRFTYVGDSVNGRTILSDEKIEYSDPGKGGDGYYHMLNDDGSLGSVIFAKIVGSNRVIDFQNPEVSLRVQQLDYTFFVRGYVGILNMFGVSHVGGVAVDEDEEREKVPAKYLALKGMKSYYDYTTPDGTCAVTREMKAFLQNFSLRNAYFLDGMGWAETESGLDSNERNQWLFACGYYG